MARPATVEEAASLIRELGTRGQAVRPIGAGTKLDWGGAAASDAEEVETGAMNRILEHNVGDFTAILEAGVPLSEAQDTFREARQSIALDAPFSGGGGGPRNIGPAVGPATIGGVLATADSGPLRHRYGSLRDLVVGVTVVLSDGTVAKSGGKVIKNVAGYDLGKLFHGSFGTLGLVTTIAVRLHPVPDETSTVVASTDDPDRLLAAVLDLARRPLEANCLDVHWEDGVGRLLVRYGGAAAARQATETVALLGALERPEAIEDDSPIWHDQRARQRSEEGAVLKVSGRATDLPVVIRAAQAGGATVVSRAALGLSWLAFAPGEDLGERVAAARAAIPRASTVLDGAGRANAAWPAADPGVQAVMNRLKERFDPARIFRPGAFVGGI